MPEQLNPGAIQETAADTIRKNLIPAYKGKPGWEALIEALAEGDAIVSENNKKAFDQLFLSTAAGVYLQRKANDVGVIEPSNVGMSDELFRQLAIRFTSKKLVSEALLEILEVFYGANSTRANIASAPGPYTLEDGHTVKFLIDDRDVVEVIFKQEDFTNITTATAPEVAAVISRALRAAGVDAYAVWFYDDNGEQRVKVYSGALGLLGSLRVTGGLAQTSLQFDTLLLSLVVALPQAQTWSVSPVSGSAGIYRFTYTAGTAPDLTGITAGDYVNISIQNHDNLTGSYPILDVHVSVDTITGSYADNVWFDIKSEASLGVIGAIPVIVNRINDLMFFRPTRFTVASLTLPSFISQYRGRGIDIVLPATTQAVNRTAKSGAYLREQAEIPIATTARGGGVVLVTTSTPHGLVDGQVVGLEDVQGETSGRWGIIGPVTTLAPTTFTIPDEYAVDGTGSGGNVIVYTAPATNGVVGPYLLDPDSGVSVTSTQSTTTTAYAKGRGYGTLQVADTQYFSSKGGYLVVGLGWDYESAPVPYLGILDSNNLILDRNYVFPNAIPSGANVTVLDSKEPWNPADPANLGSFYLTDSPAGRVAAEAFIDDTLAVGVQARKIIVYPGDRGLGGEGLGVSGQKISDKVAIWAGDVDAEVEAAHE